MNQSSSRPARKARPTLESLEDRKLLSQTSSPPSSSSSSSMSLTPEQQQALQKILNSGNPNLIKFVQQHARILNRLKGISLSDRRMEYITPQGTHVLITLYGAGSLKGSTVDSNGVLNLVFSGTGPQTGIIGKVSGGTGQAPLGSIHHADLNINDLSGVNSTLLNVVNLKNFNLINNGKINLTGGVHSLYLNSVGQNTSISLRELPAQFLTGSTSNSTSSNGVNLGFVTDQTGAETLTSVGGAFSPPIITVPTTTTTSAATIGVNPGPPPALPGVVLSITHIHGTPRSDALEDPQIFGIDPTTNTLVRFDASTGEALQSIPLTGLATAIAGVALGRDNGTQVALVGDGTTISAFNAATGAFVGSFTTSNLAAVGMGTIDGIGSTDDRTVISDSMAGTDGMAQIIDLTASLAAGQAVAVGHPFTSQQQFEMSGGLSGIPASHTIYSTGAAHFDTFTPSLTQFGILNLDTTGGKLTQSGMNPLKQNGQYINIGPPGTASSNPGSALGSVDQSLALETGVANGKNVVELLNPNNLSSQGTITLDDPNRLAGLSESFRPGLAGSALIDVQGNVQSLRSHDAQGLVFNVAGYINLAKIDRASDTLIVGQPFLHAQIPNRSNVEILTTARSVGDRNGVTIDKNLTQIGPLSLPD